jgi:hypothetical protein
MEKLFPKVNFVTANTAAKLASLSLTRFLLWGCYMDNMISVEFLLQQLDAILKTWAILIPLLVLLLWGAWKMRGIFRA